MLLLWLLSSPPEQTTMSISLWMLPPPTDRDEGRSVLLLLVLLVSLLLLFVCDEGDAPLAMLPDDPFPLLLFSPFCSSSGAPGGFPNSSDNPSLALWCGELLFEGDCPSVDVLLSSPVLLLLWVADELWPLLVSPDGAARFMPWWWWWWWCGEGKEALWWWLWRVADGKLASRSWRNKREKIYGSTFSPGSLNPAKCSLLPCVAEKARW